MSEISKLDKIICPCCGAEYLPVEIFIPKAFFGKPTRIIKDENHKIIDVVGPKQNFKEEYICDYCNTPFKVLAKTQFVTKSEIKFDFDSDYTSSLKKQSLFLEED